MATDSPSFPARCDCCGHEFRVPDPEKAYRCKACGEGRVIAERSACPACAAEVQPDDRFCEQCGAALPAEVTLVQDAGPVSPPTAARRTGRARQTRRAVSGELNRAMKSVRVLRFFFGLNALLHLLGTAAAVYGFSLTGGDRSFVLTLLLIQASMASIMLAGVFLVAHQPALWALIMACLVTLSRTIAAWQVDWNIGVLGLGIIWSLLFWALIPPAARAKRLVDAHPDLVVAKRLAAARPRAIRRASVAGVGVFAISTLAALFLHLGSAAQPLGPVWDAFVEDWEADHFSQILARVEDDLGREEREEFEAEARAAGWHRDLPDLGPAALAASEDFRLYSVEELGSGYELVELGTEHGDFNFGWRYRAEDHRWRLSSLHYPVVPFPEARKEGFSRAWEAGDLAALTRDFENPEKVERSLGRIFARHGWEETFPALNEVQISRSERTTYVYLHTVEGALRLEYQRRLGNWVAVRVRPPQ